MHACKSQTVDSLSKKNYCLQAYNKKSPAAETHTSWASSTLCSRSRSSVCLARLSSKSSLLSPSTFLRSCSACTSNFCSISWRLFNWRGEKTWSFKIKPALRFRCSLTKCCMQFADYQHELNTKSGLEIIQLWRTRWKKYSSFYTMQGWANLVLEGHCPAEFFSDPKSNTPEPLNQCLQDY